MKIILLRDVKNLGRQGDIIEVANGYGRNFLLPKNLAEFADEVTARMVQEKLQHNQRNKTKKDQQARLLAKELIKKEFQFELLATQKGVLYAGLKESEVLAKLKEDIPQLPSGTKLADYQPIKHVGQHKIKVKITPGVEAEILVALRSKGNA